MVIQSGFGSTSQNAHSDQCVAGVTESCDCDSRVKLRVSSSSRSLPTIPSTLIMDGQIDVASTSDADERELLEAANFDMYWDHVIASSQVKALPDQDDDM